MSVSHRANAMAIAAEVMNLLAYTIPRRARSLAGVTVIAGALLAGVQVGPGQANAQAQLQKYEFGEPHMGTTFTLVFYASDAAVANKAQKAAFARIRELDEHLSDYVAASELSRLSTGSPHPAPVPVGVDLWNVLQRSVAWSHATDGAFDITVGPVTRLWRRARTLKRMPDPQQRQRAQAAVGYDAIELDAAAQSVRLTRPNMRLDPGGIAKGYALDEALTVLSNLGIDRALVNGGGDLAVGEAPPDSDGWLVALADLNPQRPPRGALAVRHAAVATSGDAWQSIEIDGRRYGHIVDPATGVGLATRASVTAVARRGIDADALATAVTVFGPQRTKDWFERPDRRAPAEDCWISAVFQVGDEEPVLVRAGKLPETVTERPAP